MTEEIFDTRVREMENRLYRTARALLPSDEDCADAIQNAVFAAWRRIGSLRDENLFGPWLIRILINCCRDVQRSRQQRKREVPLEDHPVPAPNQEQNLDLERALLLLPEKWRLPIVLHYLDGLTIEEAAKVLRLPATTVKGRVHQGLERLRVLLKEEEI